VVASILGGKYLAMGSIKEEFASALGGGALWGEDTAALYEELREDARIYSELDGEDESLRAFLVQRGYSEAVDAEGVTQEEVDSFYEYDVEGLEWLATGDPSYEEWQQETLVNIGDISSTEMIMSDFGVLDLLFLALGVGTAFRLASGREA